MPKYRFYFRSPDHRIKSAQVIDCEDDTAAAIRAEILVAERPNGFSVEVWEGRRLVFGPVLKDHQ